MVVTTDGYSGLPIRPTDNGLRDGDMEAPQEARPLTEEEVAAIVEKAGEADGDR